MATLPAFSDSSVPVLVASASVTFREQMLAALNNRCPIELAQGGADALAKLEASDCRTVLLDSRLPDLDAEELSDLIRTRFPGVQVTVLDSETRTPGARSAVGSLELLQVPPERELSRAADSFAITIEPLSGMVGQTPAMLQVARLARLVAPRSSTVLLTGPTGTGKELVARAIHELSPRSARPFAVINCAAIPEALLEAELFGYVKGAFTGAVQSRVGRIHAAHGGTLFLDEVGELPIGLQAKLLRFLEQGEVQRLGSTDVFRVDVRVVAATNAELAQRVADRQFRDDLYFRLAVFPISIPPLCERKEDILRLAEHFLAIYSGGRLGFSSRAIELLLRHTWPGNVRELMHVVERAWLLVEGGSEIRSEHIYFSKIPPVRREILERVGLEKT
ncbi:MAG TPA: sigma-54 dependent transcriptional regulator [Terriglobales bacterium]|nr:sigma-54 dependent transcriptional regulator [Terriglobales bacterium]